jgi:hypothetical protein
LLLLLFLFLLQSHLKKNKIEDVSVEIADYTPSPELAQYWLIKSEPHKFSINDLRSKLDSTGCWDGVRNYQVLSLPSLPITTIGKKLSQEYENWR